MGRLFQETQPAPQRSAGRAYRAHRQILGHQTESRRDPDCRRGGEVAVGRFRCGGRMSKPTIFIYSSPYCPATEILPLWKRLLNRVGFKYEARMMVYSMPNGSLVTAPANVFV